SGPDERRPQAAMYVSHLATTQPANKYIIRLRYASEDGEYLLAFRMAPPAAPERFTCDGFRKSWNRPLGRCQHHAMGLHESDGLSMIHRLLPSLVPYSTRCTWTIYPAPARGLSARLVRLHAWTNILAAK